MPNWCYNNITIHGSSAEIAKIEKFLEERKGENWFDYFLPMPEEIKKTDGAWYEWAINNWGTKWNCNAVDWTAFEGEISFTFDSAWGPPITLYEYISNEFEDLSIQAEYLEEGMGFVGEFIDGEDNCYEYEDLEDLDYIPEHLVENWNLREMLEDRESEYDEYQEEESDSEGSQKS